MFVPEGCVVILPTLFVEIVFRCPLCKILQYLTGVKKKRQKKKEEAKSKVTNVFGTVSVHKTTDFSPHEWLPQVTD